VRVTSLSQAISPLSDHEESPRERVLSAAYDLFCHEGIRATGIDRIVAEAGVARMTLYRNFHSKDELVRAVLDRREELWTRGWIERELEDRGQTPGEKLLAIFDLFDEWFRREDYEGCLFIGCLLESHDRASSVGAASAAQLAKVNAMLRELTEAAGASDPRALADQWQMLMAGAMVVAGQGNPDAARDARDAAALLLERERPPHG
jgi:AcrR family transcriptional regulator